MRAVLNDEQIIDELRGLKDKRLAPFFKPNDWVESFRIQRRYSKADCVLHTIPKPADGAFYVFEDREGTYNLLSCVTMKPYVCDRKYICLQHHRCQNFHRGPSWWHAAPGRRRILQIPRWFNKENL